jgi:hypothetical protein
MSQSIFGPEAPNVNPTRRYQSAADWPDWTDNHRYELTPPPVEGRQVSEEQARWFYNRVVHMQARLDAGEPMYGPEPQPEPFEPSAADLADYAAWCAEREAADFDLWMEGLAAEHDRLTGGIDPRSLLDPHRLTDDDLARAGLAVG